MNSLKFRGRLKIDSCGKTVKAKIIDRKNIYNSNMISNKKEISK